MVLRKEWLGREGSQWARKCTSQANAHQHVTSSDLKENRALWLYGNDFANEMKIRALEAASPTAHPWSPSFGNTVIAKQVAPHPSCNSVRIFSTIHTSLGTGPAILDFGRHFGRHFGRQARTSLCFKSGKVLGHHDTKSMIRSGITLPRGLVALRLNGRRKRPAWPAESRLPRRSPPTLVLLPCPSLSPSTSPKVPRPLPEGSTTSGPH